MEIQRYDMIAVTRCGEGWQELQREPEGEWMLHEDHLASLAAQQEEIDRLKEENAKLQARLDAMSAPVSDEDENYCAWLRMKNGSLSVCDSDTEGAFKVWRKSGIVRLLTGRIKENQHV